MPAADEDLPAGSPAAGSRRPLLALLAASHPEPAGLVVALTALLAVGAGRGWGTVWVAAAAAAGQLAVGWSNDYLDRELDRASGRADKPLANAGLSPRTVRAAAIVALLAAVPLSFAVSVGFAVAHLVAVGLALAYNLALKGSPLSVVPYAVSFGLLPVAVALGLPSPHLPPAWAVATAALIGAGGHFTQALPDIPEDRRLGIAGLPQLVGQRVSALAAAALLLAAHLVIIVAAEARTAPAPITVAHAAMAAALTAGIVAAAAAGRPRAAFRLTLGSAALAVLAFVLGGVRL